MCCLFGIIDYKGKMTYMDRKRLLRNLSVCCEERGTDASGIAFMEDGEMHVIKCGVPAHKLRYHLPRDVRVIMGHTRLTTQGSEKKVYNNHPFKGICNNTRFALAHNGVLYNDTTLRAERNLPKTKIETDSYIAVQLIEDKRAFTIDAIKSMAEDVRGSFCFTLMDDENSIYIVKGDNPMAIFHYKKLGIYIYASTKEILSKALVISGYGKEKYEDIAIRDGDILKIKSNGEIEKYDFDSYAGYRYCFSPYSWGYDTFLSFNNKNKAKKESQYRELIDYAAIAGVCEDEVLLLLNNGFEIWEIEEMLDEPDVIINCIEALLDAEYCFE